MHAGIQQAGQAPQLVRLSCTAAAGYRLLGRQQQPQGSTPPAASLQHLVSSFAWDEEEGVAELLLPAAAAGSRCARWERRGWRRWACRSGWAR
jgi:hypothetical protein